MNEYQEAIDTLILKTSCLNDTCAYLDDCLKDGECRFKVEDISSCEDYRIAKTLQKLVDCATPMKVATHHYEDKGEEPYIKYICSNCETKGQLHSYMKFCPYCGQAILWE